MNLADLINRFRPAISEFWEARNRRERIMLALAALVVAFGLGKIAMAGIALVALLLAYEHSLVSARNLSRLNAAFFTMNGVISVVFFLFVAADLLLRRA